jgi:hypothetical protein
MTLDEFDGAVRKLHGLCQDTLADTTLMDHKLALISELKTNVTPLTTPTGFGAAMDRLVDDASAHAQRIVGSLVESPAIYLNEVQSLEKNLVAIEGEIVRLRRG